MRADPDFIALLEGWDLDRIEAEEGSVYGLWSGLRLALFSGGYERFAAENQGEACLRDYPLGADLGRALPEPLKRFYEEAWARALVDGKHWVHDYQCPSPSTERLFRMTVYPLAARGSSGPGLLVVNSLSWSRPAETVAPPPTEDYESQGILKQCRHCRRFRRASSIEPAEGTWTWIPDWLSDAPLPISHGLCVPCLEHYYPPPG